MLDLYLSERVNQLTGGNKPLNDHQTQHGSRLSHRPATLGSFSPFSGVLFLHGAACPFAMQGCQTGLRSLLALHVLASPNL